MVNTEIGMIFAMAFISALFGYFAFEMKDSEVSIWRYTAIGFFFLSLIFVNMLIGIVLLVAQNSGLTYLQDSIIVWALFIINWVTIVLIVVFLAAVFYFMLKTGMEMLAGKKKNRHKNTDGGIPRL